MEIKFWALCSTALQWVRKEIPALSLVGAGRADPIWAWSRGWKQVNMQINRLAASPAIHIYGDILSPGFGL